MNALVGYTGFVGSNIYASGNFDAAYNSKNIEEAYGTNPDLLIYAGLRAEKYLANNAPEKDLELIRQAQENIKKIGPKKLVLISTIDVFRNPVGVDENAVIECEGLPAYGLNRYMLECWVRETYPDALIVRLPGLFGQNIKKNFIYDLIQIIPFMLKEEKFQELAGKAPELKDYYALQSNGFYRCRELSRAERASLRTTFQNLGFTALNFTDSRSSYQFYPLARLWDDICTALGAGIHLWHPATEPVRAGELYEYLMGEPFVNELGAEPAQYDFRTIHDREYHGSGGYICGKQYIMEEIKRFVEEQR